MGFGWRGLLGISLGAVTLSLFPSAPPAGGQGGGRGGGNVCVGCHTDRNPEIVKEWSESRHREVGVTCEGCHGGDPRSEERAMEKAAGFLGKLLPPQIPRACARCHSDPVRMRPYNVRTDQYAQYLTSVHGKQLKEKNDPNVATCASCHGSHGIRVKTDPRSTVYRTRVAETCAKCHEDATRMGSYKLPTDQMAKYRASVHGQLLMEKGDFRAPNCADCHGTHGATPPGVQEVAQACGNCHSAVVQNFNLSPHRVAVERVGVPRCIDCHGNHDIAPPTPALFSGTEERHCGSCHGDQNSTAYQTAQQIQRLIEGAHHSLDRAGRAIRTMGAKGFDVSPELEQLREGEGGLVEALPVSHTLSLEKLKAPLGKTLTIANALQARGLTLEAELRFRRRVLLFILGLCVVVIGLLYAKYKSLP